MKPIPKITVLILFVALAFGCSSRRVYETAANSGAGARDAININTASVDELEQIPHVGRKTAEAIVEFRNANGPFRRVEHLMQIRGVSESRFLTMREFIRTE